ncbi:hypothetical protein L486_08460 [Kwoniella mangroviensis CBS 10435]|uniref:Uncharacterized protein n=1 Tax=Kwoniella mangroviensis CBS 10435 TaxID=1331196 RepID=A0A1B9IF22_9TREE|nr:uncharacterized protein I203_08108 [Kwoniella mangroviensis CBS 8507]OCF54057.1 hypothetical protein L486_08460 [Kwoniella mangroviensis CBS 10435]OCF62793.1 hypothetical protein I203_08108 [Kwoniella mangroviensis CBS 8507]
MPVPTHLTPLPISQDSKNNQTQHHHNPHHPLADPGSNPTSAMNPTHQTQRHPHFEQQMHQHHPHQRDSHSRSPSHHEHPSETEPMLSSTHSDRGHDRHPSHSAHPAHPAHHNHYNHHVTSPHPLAHHDATTAQSLPIPPPKSPKSPKSPTPLSKRLLYALTNKPTISKTWEKRSYADQQRSEPLDGSTNQGRAEMGMGMDLQEYSSPRSRPMSFYASPAEIAAFKPLPVVDHHYPSGDTHAHAHSAPNLPVPPTRV